MQKLLKAINKFNGNICFAGSTDSGDVVFECDYQDHILTYDFSSRSVTDVCLETEDSYLVAFSNNWIGQFSDGVLNETYINTGLSNVDRIVNSTSSKYYILNKTTNQLVRYQSGVVWTFNLPDYSLRQDGNIYFRESDEVVIYYNNENIYIIRDDVTYATLMNSLIISSASGDISIVINNEFNPAYSYIRARTVTGKELEQSSSSSSGSP